MSAPPSTGHRLLTISDRLPTQSVSNTVGSSGVRARFIRIEGGRGQYIQLSQLVVVDSRYINVAVGKPTFGSTPDSGRDTWKAVNGIFAKYSYYKSANPTDPTATWEKNKVWFEVDLGREYDIMTIIYFNFESTGDTTNADANYRHKIILYNKDRSGTPTERIMTGINNRHEVIKLGTITYLPKTFKTVGHKTRYVRISGRTLHLAQIAVIDCKGRNVASNKIVTSISGTTSRPITDGVLTGYREDSQLLKTPLTNDAWIEIDLEEEYYITNVICYARGRANNADPHSPNSNPWATNCSTGVAMDGATLQLLDANRVQTATKTLTNEAGSWNIKQDAGATTRISNWNSCPTHYEDVASSTYSSISTDNYKSLCRATTTALTGTSTVGSDDKILYATNCMSGYSIANNFELCIQNCPSGYRVYDNYYEFCINNTPVGMHTNPIQAKECSWWDAGNYIYGMSGGNEKTWFVSNTFDFHNIRRTFQTGQYSGDACAPKECFPSNSKIIKIINNKYIHTTIDTIRIGDSVLSYNKRRDSLEFSKIYFIGHQNNSIKTQFYECILHNNVSIRLTGDHILYVKKYNKILCKKANTVKQDDDLLYIENNTLKVSKIKEIKIVESQGLYNPYTFNGNIIVDGILASCHSDVPGLSKIENIIYWIFNENGSIVCIYLYEILFIPIKLLFILSDSEIYDNYLRNHTKNAFKNVSLFSLLFDILCILYFSVVKSISKYSITKYV